MEIQTTSEMTPYFTITKCNKLFITYLTCFNERFPTILYSISPISMTVVKTTLLNMHAHNRKCTVSGEGT